MRPLSRSARSKLNESLRDNLARTGMVFNATDPEKFRGTLRAAGFYTEWKEKYGPEAWAVFEKQVGALA
jgi:hypothetical protein